ncbi:MAG TPA: hypothetical protein PK957_04460 [Candidatus Dojkabacteria bacterium]|mgnify:CR=1 FL=1|nr:hypothetical protein [Candidatus Dojkabacteria bacterium]HQF36981.1 hypothetical protein [Candidatus Dojkabacteria bacterium]
MSDEFKELHSDVGTEGDPVLGLSVLPSLIDNFDKLSNFLITKGYSFNTELHKKIWLNIVRYLLF